MYCKLGYKSKFNLIFFIAHHILLFLLSFTICSQELTEPQTTPQEKIDDMVTKELIKSLDESRYKISEDPTLKNEINILKKVEKLVIDISERHVRAFVNTLPSLVNLKTLQVTGTIKEVTENNKNLGNEIWKEIISILKNNLLKIITLEIVNTPLPNTLEGLENVETIKIVQILNDKISNIYTDELSSEQQTTQADNICQVLTTLFSLPFLSELIICNSRIRKNIMQLSSDIMKQPNRKEKLAKKSLNYLLIKEESYYFITFIINMLESVENLFLNDNSLESLYFLDDFPDTISSGLTTLTIQNEPILCSIKCKFLRKCTGLQKLVLQKNNKYLQIPSIFFYKDISQVEYFITDIDIYRQLDMIYPMFFKNKKYIEVIEYIAKDNMMMETMMFKIAFHSAYFNKQRSTNLNSFIYCIIIYNPEKIGYIHPIPNTYALCIKYQSDLVFSKDSFTTFISAILSVFTQLEILIVQFSNKQLKEKDIDIQSEVYRKNSNIRFYAFENIESASSNSSNFSRTFTSIRESVTFSATVFAMEKNPENQKWEQVNNYSYLLYMLSKSYLQEWSTAESLVETYKEEIYSYSLLLLPKKAKKDAKIATQIGNDVNYYLYCLCCYKNMSDLNSNNCDFFSVLSCGHQMCIKCLENIVQYVESDSTILDAISKRGFSSVNDMLSAFKTTEVPSRHRNLIFLCPVFSCATTSSYYYIEKISK